MGTYYALRASNGYVEAVESTDPENMAAWIAHHSHGSTPDGFDNADLLIHAAESFPGRRFDSDAGACLVSICYADECPYWIDRYSPAEINARLS